MAAWNSRSGFGSGRLARRSLPPGAGAASCQSSRRPAGGPSRPGAVIASAAIAMPLLQCMLKRILFNSGDAPKREHQVPSRGALSFNEGVEIEDSFGLFDWANSYALAPPFCRA